MTNQPSVLVWTEGASSELATPSLHIKSTAFPRLFLALMLIAAQALILGLGLFAPRVSPEYRAFFIEHSLQEWPGGNG